MIGGRVDKDDTRVEAYGTVDEINSFIGLAVARLGQDERFMAVSSELRKIQHELFDLGGDLANRAAKRPYTLKEEAVAFLEKRIDEYMAKTPEIRRFILPGGEEAASLLHVARTVTRRAERAVVRLMKAEEVVPPLALVYLNRLSDYFFALARFINAECGQKDVEYVRGQQVFTDHPDKPKDNNED